MKNILILATHNEHKSEEIKAIIGDLIEIKTLSDIGFNEDIPETGLTLQANALQKAEYVHKAMCMNCFADDTGLEVNALNGEPGVFSARYAGEPSNPKNNIKKLLHEMKDASDRGARFRTVIALIYNEKRYYFEGIVEGHITEEPRGEKGFGYDSVFIPEGYGQTFAELDTEIKNSISHRSKALEKARKFFQEQVR
jgi:XTP/dITP diphosphohydrolase